VAANFRKEVTSTVLWLEEHNVEIKCIKVTPYLDGDKLCLDTEQILPMQDVGDYQIRRIAKERDEVASGKEEALRHKLRREFWAEALPVLREKTAIFNNISPTKYSWLTGARGRSGISYHPVIHMSDSRAEIYIDFGDKERNKQVFHALLEMKAEIEAQFSGTLIWQELPERKASRIYTPYDISGLTDRSQWQSVIDFLAHSIAELLRVFRQPIDTAGKE